MQSWKQPTIEMVEKALSSVKKETDRQYFFSRLQNPLWVTPLRERGYFKSPPGIKQLPDNCVQYPNWPELAYLVAVADNVAEEAVDIVLNLPKTDNPHVYNDIIAIALKLEGQKSARLLPKLVEYTELENQFFAHQYPELLQLWSTQGNIDEAFEIVKKLIPFREDPRAREKQKNRKKDSNPLGTLLEPAPRFNQWEYEQILEKGVRPIAENKPYQAATILIDAVASMIQMGMHPEDLDNGRDEDFSEIWCRKLDTPDRDYQNSKETLVHTLTYACEQVYDKAPNFIDALDKELRKQRWKVFKRLRQHLYASHPNDQTLPWIRELILGHDDYSKWEHHYEFQFMIRKTSDFFGPHLLSEEESSAIFAAILSGPSRGGYREWMGERYSEEAFQQRQRYFHRVQLRPFSALLIGEVERYFNELESETQTEAVTDNSYSPYGGVTSGIVSYRSPKSAEELESYTDKELLAFLNDWDEEHHEKGNWLIEINISALAGVFQSLFNDRVIPDDKRLAFWMEHRNDIARPIYVTAMVKAMNYTIKNNNLSYIAQWINFCEWVLLHPDSERMEGQPDSQDESRDHPDWGSSRRAVVEFIDTCVNKDTDAPITARDSLTKLLQQVCNQFDWRLDHDRPVMLNRDDPISEAINNTRSRALESLVNFGSWIRRHLPEDHVQEVINILDKRMVKGAVFPLSRPEHALLGVHFGKLCTFNRDWAIKQRAALFPQDNVPVWRAAFGSYIRYNSPVKVTFEILREDFEYALDNLSILTTAKSDGNELIDGLGQHLFTYYLWQVFPLMGEESLLARFYEKTSNDRKNWTRLFDHVGSSLRNSGEYLDRGLTDRAIAFFDWRFEAAEPMELQEFTFWLGAECLDPEWRLQSYSKILNLGRGKDIGLSLEVRALNKLLPDHLALAVECFYKIIFAIDQSTQMYIAADEAIPILRAGLNADDPQVRDNAERAREKLLQCGRFDFLDIE